MHTQRAASVFPLDELRSQRDRIVWKLTKRRKSGLLGLSFIADEDNLCLPVKLESVEVDKACLFFDEQIKIIDDKIEYLQSVLYTDASNNQYHAEDAHFELLDDGDIMPPHSEESSSEVTVHSVKVREDLNNLNSKLEEVTKRRSPYRRTYACAFYTRILLEEDREGNHVPEIHRDKSRAGEHFYLGHSLQTGYQQSEAMFVSSKQVVSILEQLHNPTLDTPREACIPEGILSLVTHVACMFERSLQQCSKMSPSVIAASGVAHYAMLSVQRISEIIAEYSKGYTPVQGQKEPRWIHNWEECLQRSEEIFNSNSVSRHDESIDGNTPESRLLFTRAKILRNDVNIADPARIRDRKDISFATIRSKITRAYPDKIIFDRPPEQGYCTIQRGSCGKVYKVTLSGPQCFTTEVDTYYPHKLRFHICREVAVKKALVSPSLSEGRICARILRELETRIVLRHECILPLIGLWNNFDNTAPNYPLLVSPWMENGDLRYYIERHPDTTIHERLVFLRDVASALAYMHGHHDVEFVHGDLKADNVLVGTRRAYLHDFGTARIIGEDDKLKTQNLLGNWRWQSPELLDHHRGALASDIHATPQSDMYAYGSLLLEVLTGKYPWDMPEALEYRIKNRGKIQKRPDGLQDDRYWMLMKHCWMEEPRLRVTARDALIQVKLFLTADKPEHEKQSVEFMEKYLY